MPNQPDRHQRSHLPIPEIPPWTITTYDAKDPDTKFPPIEPLRPPEGAPNVLIVLLDDVGFGASSAFGGPCQTPTFEKLAAGGLRYNRFHTCALCAPTRQALHDRPQPSLGRNGQHHRNRDRGAGPEFTAAQHQGADCAHPQAQRLLDGNAGQVP